MRMRMRRKRCTVLNEELVTDLKRIGRGQAAQQSFDMSDKCGTEGH